jgi:WD40 repeat protein
MSYCLNPNCQSADSNPISTKFCQSCGTKLLLLSRYRALQLIGQGGFGRTFLAVDEGEPSKPRCVIKQFFAQAQGTNNARKAAELFEQEAIRLETLGKHPQIPQLLAHFEQDNQQYLVQEFIDGPNLAQVLKAEGVFSERQIRDLLKSLLPVVEFIHTHNVIHRDIKPENIIRRSDGQWVLVDFGAAKVATGTALARTGTAIGSAGYAAPEQTGGKATFSSDLYSLGVTCIHLLTQTEPFDLYSFSEATWIWREYLARPVSKRLGQVLDKMLAIATSRRYASAGEVLNALTSRSHQHQKAIASGVTSAKTAVQLPQVPSVDSTPTSNPPIQNWECDRTFQGHTRSIRSLAISPDGQILASGSDDKTIKLWQLDTGEELCTLKGHTRPVYSVAISPDGQILASGSDDKTIKLWQLSTGKKFATLTLGNWFSGHSGCVYSVVFSPDGRTLASLSSGGTIKLWQLATGREIHTLMGQTSWVHSITFSPDGQFLAGGSDDNAIKLWQLSTGRRLRTLKGHGSWVHAVAFSPDGRILASGSDDQTIKLWDLKSGQELRTLTGHISWVHAIAFSPDGQTLVSGSCDRTIKLWDVRTGQELCTLTGHTSWIHAVVFSPDGQTIISGSDDNLIKIWRCY